MAGINESIFKWNLFELEFESIETYENPYIDLELNVEFISPEGRKLLVPGFWDGGKTWRVRFAPPSEGCWSWESRSASNDEGLDGKRGHFSVNLYKGNNPIYKNGFLKISEDRRTFSYDDGTPFFWLGDTLWSCPAKATIDEWKEITSYRKEQGFNIVQVNVLPQHDSSGENKLRFPFNQGPMFWDLDKIETDYFKEFDKQMLITVNEGMFAAIVALWFNNVPGTNPTWQMNRKANFTPDQAARYGRYLAARYGAFGPIWLISGDSDFENPYSISVYDAAADSIVANLPYKPLMTAHLNGGLFTTKKLEEKNWLNFHMYQSSHVRNSELIAAKYTEELRNYARKKPIINGEPVYEGIGFYMEGEIAQRSFVRKTAWYSILAGGNAGITYGAHGLWNLHRRDDVFTLEAEWKMPPDWQTAITFEGSEDYVRLKNFFESLPWWELEPSNEILDGNMEERCIAAATKDRKIIVVYVKELSTLCISLDELQNYEAIWFNPSSGEKIIADFIVDGKHFKLGEIPWNGEAVLLMTSMSL